MRSSGTAAATAQTVAQHAQIIRRCLFVVWTQKFTQTLTDVTGVHCTAGACPLKSNLHAFMLHAGVHVQGSLYFACQMTLIKSQDARKKIRIGWLRADADVAFPYLLNFTFCSWTVLQNRPLDLFARTMAQTARFGKKNALWESTYTKVR